MDGCRSKVKSSRYMLPNSKQDSPPCLLAKDPEELSFFQCSSRAPLWTTGQWGKIFASPDPTHKSSLRAGLGRGDPSETVTALVRLQGWGSRSWSCWPRKGEENHSADSVSTTPIRHHCLPFCDWSLAWEITNIGWEQPAINTLSALLWRNGGRSTDQHETGGGEECRMKSQTQKSLQWTRRQGTILTTIGWPTSSSRFFHKMLMENPNKLFGRKFNISG